MVDVVPPAKFRTAVDVPPPLPEVARMAITLNAPGVVRVRVPVVFAAVSPTALLALYGWNVKTVPVLVVLLVPSFVKVREFGKPSVCPPMPASNQAAAVALVPSNPLANGVAVFSVTTSTLKPVTAMGTEAAIRVGAHARSATPTTASNRWGLRTGKIIRVLPML